MKVCAFVLMVVSHFGVAHAQQVSARVIVRSDQDVVALHELGMAFADARVEERTGMDGARLQYCPENGFVTVVGSLQQMNLLQRQGYTLTNMHELSPVPDPLRTSAILDTIPYQFGWPRTIFNGNSLYENSPTVADMDLNGQLDVSVTNAWGSYPSNPPYLIVWRRNGAYLAGFPTALQEGQLQSSADGGISAAADIFGDNKLELVLGDENGFLYAFNSNGASLAGFPVNYGGDQGVFTPALADFDADGKADIAVISHRWSSPYTNAFLHLLKVTPTGPVEFTGFPIALELGTQNSPAVGDLDADGQLEIVVGTGAQSSASITGKVIAYSRTGQVKPGYPWDVGNNSVTNTPTLFDIDRNGTLEILIRIRPDFSGINGIYALNHTGSVLPGFPFPITFGNPGACVAVGDMTGDNVPELAYGGVEAVDSGKVWVYSLDGVLLPGFPARVFRTWVDGSVAIADVNGDGLGDVVCGTNGVTNKPGVICAFNNVGQTIEGFPLSPGSPIINSFETHPTLVDIDGDGDTEIFAGRLDKYVYGWDTQGLFDSTKAWTTYKGNAARTGGQLRSPFPVSVYEDEDAPTTFSLSQNYPNPFNPTTNLRFQIADFGFVSLKVFNVLGQEVATLVNEIKNAGEHTVTFDGAGLSSSVYVYRMQAGRFVETKKLMLLK